MVRVRKRPKCNLKLNFIVYYTITLEDMFNKQSLTYFNKKNISGIPYLPSFKLSTANEATMTYFRVSCDFPHDKISGKNGVACQQASFVRVTAQ